MKKGINLLAKHKKYLDVEKFFATLKQITIFVSVVYFITYVVFFVLLQKQNNELNDLNSIKQTYLQYLLENKEVEAKYIYFSAKQKQITDILKQDVNFYPYYSLLNDSLKVSSEVATLQSLVLSKDRSVNFTLSFSDFGNMLNFLRQAETDTFLKDFVTLHLLNFSTTKQQGANSYQLEFRGKFREL